MNQPRQQRCRIAKRHLATNTAARKLQESFGFDAEAPLPW